MTLALHLICSGTSGGRQCFCSFAICSQTPYVTSHGSIRNLHKEKWGFTCNWKYAIINHKNLQNFSEIYYMYKKPIFDTQFVTYGLMEAN